jgi:hypothetical protein
LKWIFSGAQMTEQNSNAQTIQLRADVKTAVDFFLEQLKGAIGENIKSLTIVGSSLTEDYRPGQSDINTVLVLQKRNMMTLNTIAALGKLMRKKKIASPLLMTDSYIERSRDVFGVEFLDFQHLHKTVFGDDPFDGISFDKNDVRLQCERELKAILIRLRQGYISSVGNKILIRDMLIATSKSLGPIIKAMLWLKDIDRSINFYDTLEKAKEEFAIDIEAIKEANEWRLQKTKPGSAELEQIFDRIYKCVDKLAEIVDGLDK